ncbi:MAG: hypothetical protein JSV70_00470 [bacterium]|nr:MAG: hypothetical protein JSV70_00470 [bacterium]
MIKNIVASRKVKAVDFTGKTFDLTIVIGLPFEVGHDEWACPVSMEGLYKQRGPIFGVDSFQALMLAVKFVKDLLKDFQDKGGSIYWADDSKPASLNDLMHL